MTYDNWKCTNPQDEFLGNTHEDNPTVCQECDGTGWEIHRPKPWDAWYEHFTGKPCPYCDDGRWPLDITA